MKPQTPTAIRVIDAPPDAVYPIIADYRNTHWLILPKQYFLSLDVEEGGFGSGTIVNFKMRLLGQTQSFRSRITEPEPGRLLVETDVNSGIATSFQVLPVGSGGQSQVTISTELKGRNAVEGWLAKIMLQRVYREELDLLAQVAQERIKLDAGRGRDV